MYKMRFVGNRAINLWNNAPFFKKTLLRSSCCCYCTQNEQVTDKKYSLFFDVKVQELLKKLTEKDLEKVFRKRKFGEKPQTPEFKFMTDEELAKALKDAEIRADKKLQMPPVLPVRKEIDHVFICDSKLKGYSESKFVFTDITYGKNDRDRLIVVREPDGTLRKANWEERSRMNEIYFSRPGRKLWMPIMFKEEFLKDLLNRKEYLFILDRACLQFEPDDPDYVRVTTTVYNQINEISEFNEIRSTRHYGPLVFYLIINRNIENLLSENLETDRLQEAVWVLDLYNIIHPESKCDHKYVKGEELDYIKVFIDQCSANKGKLELIYNKYKDSLRSKLQALN